MAVAQPDAHENWPLASCLSPTALKRPDRSKQCHCLEVIVSGFETRDL